jgi:hypothetical protein
MRNKSSSPPMTSCIFWGDSPQDIYENSSSPIVTCNNIQGGHVGEGNIDADPLFVDPANGVITSPPAHPASTRPTTLPYPRALRPTSMATRVS